MPCIVERTLALSLIFVVPALLLAAPDKSPTFTDASLAGADYVVQGEYLGQIHHQGEKQTFGLQVIARGDGKFQAVLLEGGLPGEGWERGQERKEFEGETKDGVTTFKCPDCRATLADGVMTLTNSGGDKIGELTKVDRKSPTLGKEPPEGAVVLFDGSSTENFTGGKLTDDGLLQPSPSATSKQSFSNFTMHIEFRTPFMPAAEGQARGNSGVYVINRYEIQVLDSFGLEGKNNECGGIYSVQDPKVNMCFPPLNWQTYDVDFVAPKFDKAGKKTANARITVQHNGVAVYESFELPGLTPGGAGEEGPMGPLMLQDHGNPVNYRNVWILEKKE